MSLDDRIVRAAELLRQIESDFSPAVFANSLGAEDMVLTDLIARHAPGIGMFSLDTGRLPQETYGLMERIARRYSIKLQVYFPDAAAVEAYANEHGINGFYRSVELRQACCHIRKVEPLRRALRARRAWVTGLRRAQGGTRAAVQEYGFDSGYGLHKFSPLVEWSDSEVWNYIARFEVPYNALHDRGYPSIGCAPCTRAVQPGEDIRAGRWWWELPEHKECGLHLPQADATRAAANEVKKIANGIKIWNRL
jgi:phosphoadenosine phosphosulfate reductase